MLDRVQTPAEQVLSRGTKMEASPLSLARARALSAFSAMGLPSRRQEYWHYTDLRILLRDVPEKILPPKADLRPSFLENFRQIGLVNGQALAQDLPSYIKPLRPQFEEGNESYLPIWQDGDVVSQINAAHVSDGFKIDLAQDDFLEIQNLVEGGQAHIHLPIHIAANTRPTIILREIGEEDASSFSTTTSSLEIGPRAEVTFIILRQRGNMASELNQFKARLGEGARLKLFIVNAGGKLVRQEVNVEMLGRGSDFQLRGVNLLNGRTHNDLTMDVRHLVEHSTSTEILRNVVMGRARGVFQGMIRVSQQAQKTDARMSCNSLILSDEAEFDAKPELEIFADDVACGHGATVADINQEHLFYLMARGIPEQQARILLIKAFVDELTEEIEDDMLQQSIKNMIDQWLDCHT